jgi:MraZ protein
MTICGKLCYFVSLNDLKPSMSNFLGEYEVTLDSKGRFMLPIGYKRQLGEAEGARFVLSRGFEKCLTLYTEAQWEKVSAVVRRLNDFSAKARTFKRVFLNGATIVEPDAAGRVLISKSMIEHAGLSKDLTFSAQMDKVEIWDTETFRKETSMSSEDLSDLANEVLGNDFINPIEGI